MHTLKVCMGSSCFARGNMSNLEYIENFISENNLSDKIDLVGAHCQNKCESGPHIFVDDKMSSDDNIEIKLGSIKLILLKLLKL